MGRILIPADMNDPRMAEALGATAVVSVRDLLILLGAGEDEIRGYDIGYEDGYDDALEMA